MARFGARRPYEIRDTLPIIMIVCDDAKTAPSYFRELRSILREHCTVKVVPAMRHGATGPDLIEYAVQESKSLSDNQGVTVWVLVDLEMRSDSIAFSKKSEKKASTLNLELLLSQPCFEAWILLHLTGTGQLFSSCDQVLQEVKKHWKNAFNQPFPQKKAQADYRKLMDRVESAIQNAKQHDSSNSQSWTQVWMVAEHAMPFKK